MGELLESIRRFLAELKRRNVYRVAITYAAVAFVGLQAARMAVPLTTLPAWADELMLALAIMGFPIAVVVAWAFELTPEGVRPTPEAGEPDSGPAGDAKTDRGPTPEGSRTRGGRRGVALAVLALVLAGGGAWWLIGSSGSPHAEAPESRSVAVLPFLQAGSSGSDGDLGLGLTDAVISELAVVEDLTPVARTEVERFRGSRLPVTDIADSLDVEFLVEGSVQRSGDSLRVDARLLRGDTGRPIWSRSFGGDFSRIFDVQSDVALAVVDAVEARATEEERRRIRDRPTGDPAAYSLYLRARELVGESPENEAALELLHQAIRLDSSFALAYAELAEAYEDQADRGLGAGFRDTSLAMARRAVEVDPKAAEAHVVLGDALAEVGRTAEAERSYRRALALEPGNARAMYEMGYLNQVVLGRHAEAIRWFWRVLAHLPSDPHPRSAIAISLYQMGEDAAVRAWRERMLELGGPRLRRFLVAGAIGRGELDAARRHLEKFREWDADHALVAGYSGLLAQLAGDTAAALESYRRAVRRPPHEAVLGIPSELRVAHLLRARGQTDRSDSLAGRLIREGRGSRYALAAAHQVVGDTAESRRWLDSAYAAGQRYHRARRRDPIWRGVDYAREHFDRIKRDLEAQKAQARRWVREEGIDWPPFPPEREVWKGEGADSVPAVSARGSRGPTSVPTGTAGRPLAAARTLRTPP